MAMAPSITCVLIDVGGTLWPSGWVGSDVEEAGRCANLARALPALAPPRNSELSACLRTCAAEDTRGAGQTLVQDVPATLRRAAQQCGLDLDPHQVQALHRALRVSPVLAAWFIHVVVRARCLSPSPGLHQSTISDLRPPCRIIARVFRFKRVQTSAASLSGGTRILQRARSCD